MAHTSRRRCQQPSARRHSPLAMDLQRQVAGGSRSVESATHHCIALSLKCTSLTFSHAGKTLVRGRVAAGAVQITAPDVRCSAVFESPADVLHLSSGNRS